jgi:adenylate kinase
MDKFVNAYDFIFLLGEPGGGKGTLLENAKKYWKPDLRCKGMGDIFREKSKTSPKIKALVESGTLIEDSVVVELFKDFAVNNAPGLIDGFPRSKEQAAYAVKLTEELDWKILVVDLNCSTENIVKRLLARGRADDKLEIIQKRSENHKKNQPAILEEFYNRPDLFDVIILNGDTTPELVCQEFLLKMIRKNGFDDADSEINKTLGEVLKAV